MTYKAKFFHPLHIARDAQPAAADGDNALADLMANPEYLRHSSSIINEALKDGFDVLQLPNGDIVTTGTKIITNTYVWDAVGGKLMKSRASASETREKPAKRKPKAAPAPALEEEEAE
ncbi:MAG: hypothetical protein B7X02_01410 [Rhodospirillales bacterium 12-54-5]|nr:MAG: hypothetical protein B7X02_01410 [Rhodospirillales bacterium 12-54-5]